MTYFANIFKGKKVFGLVYGLGTIINVTEDAYYAFEVEYENGQRVPYSIEGIPTWGKHLDFQTVFYKEDVDLFKFDFSPYLGKLLSAVEIISLRNNNQLEVKTPSGIWRDITLCPNDLVEEYLENNNLHLFRAKII